MKSLDLDLDIESKTSVPQYLILFSYYSKSIFTSY